MQVINASMSIQEINAVMTARLATNKSKNKVVSIAPQETDARMDLSYGDEHINRNVFERMFSTEDPGVIPSSLPEAKENTLVPKQETETEIRSASPKPPEVIVDPALEAVIAADAAAATGVDVNQVGLSQMEAAYYNASKNAKRNASRNRR